MKIPELKPAFEPAINLKWIANINPGEVAIEKLRASVQRIYDRWLQPPKV